MTVAQPVSNGRPQRKLLSEELDRLDSIVDAIAEGLPAAVAAAAREGTRQAVKDAILEIVTNPELRALLQTPTSTAPSGSGASEPAAAKPSLWSRIKARLAIAKNAIRERTRIAKSIVVETVKAVTRIVPVDRIVLVVSIGMLAGVAMHFAPAGLSAAIACVAAAVTAGVVRAGHWIKRSARTLLATG